MSYFGNGIGGGIGASLNYAYAVDRTQDAMSSDPQGGEGYRNLPAEEQRKQAMSAVDRTGARQQQEMGSGFLARTFNGWMASDQTSGSRPVGPSVRSAGDYGGYGGGGYTTSSAEDIYLSRDQEERLQSGQTLTDYGDPYGGGDGRTADSTGGVRRAGGDRLQLSTGSNDNPRVLELESRIKRLTAISNEARALNAATSGISLDRQLAQIEDAAQAYRNSGMVGSTGDSQNYDTSSPNGATAGQANYLGADGRLYDSPQQSVVITGKRMTPEESAAYDAEQARARLDQATNDQVTAGTYNRFSAIGNALQNRDYSVAWFHVNHEASDAAKQATRDRMYPQQSPAMARLDRMLSSPIGATASVVGRMFGASQNTQDALLATGALAEQLAGAGTGVYKQTLTATPPMATVLGSRPRGVGSYPLGFSTQSEFAAFGNSLYSGLESAGFRNVRAGFQGSSVTGRAYKAPNLPFDAGRLSDYDVALSSSELFGQAQAIGMGLRQQGMRTGPLLPEHLDRLGLTEVSNQLSLQAGRPVKFMIYRSIDDAAGRSPTIPVPRDQP